MNPEAKKKAKERVDAYLNLFKKTDTCFLDDCPTSVACQHSRYKCKGWLNYAKECAKIESEEIIKSNPIGDSFNIMNTRREAVEDMVIYYQEVIEEIDNL